MKHPYESLFPFLLLALFCALCVRPAHAAISHPNFSNTPYFSGQLPIKPGSTIFENPTPILYSSSPFIPNATANNPQGYQASAVNGAVKLEAPTAIAAPSPAGQSVSPALQASAAALAGGATLATAAAFTPTISNPAGVISAASTFMLAGAAGVSLFNPPVGAALAAAGLLLQGGLATCNVVGCSFLDGLKTQGIQVAADGAVNKISGSGTVPVVASSYYLDGSPSWVASTPEAVCTYSSNFCSGYGGRYIAPMTCSGKVSAFCMGLSYAILPNGSVSCPSGYTLDASGTTCSGAGASAPATDVDLVAAIAAITASSSSANFKADMVNLGLQNGMPMPAEAQTAQDVQVASAFTQLSSVTDSLGNTVQTLARNVASIVPGANASLPPVVTNSIQQVTVTNSVPSSITTTSIVDATAAAVAAAAGQVTQDMCVQHPDILACADISNLNDLPAVTPLTSEKNISSLTPVTLGAGMAVCPPPLALPGMFGGGVMYLDIWKYPCQFAGAIKPITIAAAGMASIFILMGAFRNG